MANAVKILHDYLFLFFFFFLSENNERIMLYETVKNYCVLIYVKETEFSYHMLSHDAKNEKLKASPLKTDEGQNNIFHYLHLNL